MGLADSIPIKPFEDKLISYLWNLVEDKALHPDGIVCIPVDMAVRTWWWNEGRDLFTVEIRLTLYAAKPTTVKTKLQREAAAFAHPASWVEAMKLAYLPGWARDIWPVRYEQIIIPEASLSGPTVSMTHFLLPHYPVQVFMSKLRSRYILESDDTGEAYTVFDNERCNVYRPLLCGMQESFSNDDRFDQSSYLDHAIRRFRNRLISLMKYGPDREHFRRQLTIEMEPESILRPATWVDAVKSRFFPEWLLKRYPIQEERFCGQREWQIDAEDVQPSQNHKWLFVK